MARLLTVLDYGVLATLVSITYIANICTESIQLVVAKHVASEKNNRIIKYLFKKSLRSSFFLALFLFVFYLLICIPLTSLLDISYSLLSLNGLIIFTACLLPVTRGLLQGKKKFKSLGINMVLESSIKLILSTGLVLIGYGVYGAVGAILLGATVSLFFSFTVINGYLSIKEKSTSKHSLYEYSIPSFIITGVTIAMYSLDIVVARIVFDAHLAGSYAIASMLGKAVLWGTLPISKTLFPLSAEHAQKKKESKSLLLNAIFFLSGLLLPALAIFFFFPDLIISFFSGKSLPETSSILFYICLGMGIISLANLNLMHKLSRGEVKNSSSVLLFIPLQLILLFYFSNSLMSFSIAFIASTIAFLLGSHYLLRK